MGIFFNFYIREKFAGADAKFGWCCCRLAAEQTEDATELSNLEKF